MACLGLFVDGCAVSGLPLAFVVLVEQQTSSFARAGSVAAATLIGAAISSPLKGRLVDAAGPQRVIAPLATCRVLVVLGMTWALTIGAPWGATLGLAVLSGSMTPPLYTTLRGLWKVLLDDQARVRSGYAAQSVTTEAFFIGGPLLAVPLISWVGAGVAVATFTLLSFVGTAIFLSPTPVRNRRGSGHLSLAGVWRPTAAVARLAGLSLFLGAIFGVLEIALPALADVRGEPEEAGLALATLALGGLVGGTVYGVIEWRAGPRRRFELLIAGFGLTLMPLILVNDTLGAAAVLGVAGLFVAPTTATTFELVDVVASSSRTTEAFSWTSASYTAGIALGAWVAGMLVRSDCIALALALPAVFAAASFVFVRRARWR